jgi:hypothetical protein
MTNTETPTVVLAPADYFAAGLLDTPPAETIDSVVDADKEWTVEDIDAFWEDRAREDAWHAEEESRFYGIFGL